MLFVVRHKYVVVSTHGLGKARGGGLVSGMQRCLCRRQQFAKIDVVVNDKYLSNHDMKNRWWELNL
jgi:hypothetical protein